MHAADFFFPYKANDDMDFYKIWYCAFMLHADWMVKFYEGGPKYFRNLNLPHKRDIFQGSATR